MTLLGAGLKNASRWAALGALALALALLAGACASGASTPGTVVVGPRTEIIVVDGTSRSELNDASERTRMAAAKAALERALGHAVLIEIDSVLIANDGGGAVTVAANSIEILARYFAHASDKAFMSFVRSKLVRICARYRAGEEYLTGSFDDASGSLIFSLRDTNRTAWAHGPFEIDSALEEAYLRDARARYASVDPRRVLPADDEVYLRYLSTPWSPDRHHSEDALQYGERITKLLAFEQATRGRTVHAAVESYLAEQSSRFLKADQSAEGQSASGRAYARWVEERFFSTTTKIRNSLYEKLGGLYRCPDSVCPPSVIDLTKIALGFFEHPVPPDEEPFGAFDQALCPYEEQGQAIRRNRSCRSIFSRLTTDPAQSDLLASVLAKSGRRDWLISALSEGRLSALLAALEKQPGSTYPTALTILLDVDSADFRNLTSFFFVEAKRLWSRRADLRPVLLRALIEAYRRQQHPDETYAKLPDEFGPIDAVLFAKFLDLGPRAVELAPVAWPAFARVGAPFEILAPRLGTYVAGHPEKAMVTVTAIVRRACQARDYEGLRVIRTVLERQAKDGNPDALSLALTVHDCKAAP